MINSKIQELGARLIGEKVAAVGSIPKEIEYCFKVSPTYRGLLQAIGGAVVFDKGAKYRPEKPTPLTRHDGYNSLELLFGTGSGEHSISQKIEDYKEQLPLSMVPFGEAPGGNLLCVDKSCQVFLWDHESLEDEQPHRVATSLDNFVANLEADNAPIGSTDGIIESQSFLDF
jgi:hypothetical protein